MANNQQSQPTQVEQQNSSSSGMLGGLTDKMSSAVGRQSSGDDQSYLSKGIDAVQRSVYGQGDQSGSAEDKTVGMGQEKQEMHNAVDQAHPEKISEFLRDKYYSRTEEQEKEDAGK